MELAVEPGVGLGWVVLAAAVLLLREGAGECLAPTSGKNMTRSLSTSRVRAPWLRCAITFAFAPRQGEEAGLQSAGL